MQELKGNVKGRTGSIMSKPSITHIKRNADKSLFVRVDDQNNFDFNLEITIPESLVLNEKTLVTGSTGSEKSEPSVTRSERWDDGSLFIRFDDPNNFEFWLEMIIPSIWFEK